MRTQRPDGSARLFFCVCGISNNYIDKVRKIMYVRCIHEKPKHQRRKEGEPMKGRQFTDDQLKALANVFNIDTGDAFKPITDEEIAAKAEVEELFRKGATE